MGGTRWRLGRITLALALAISLLLPNGSPASAHSSWFVDDGCAAGGGGGGYFYAGGPAIGWRTQGYGPSPGGCHMWAFTRVGSFSNWAAWYLPVTGGYEGNYDLETFVPCVNNAGVAHYLTYPHGTGGGIVNNIFKNQSATCNARMQVIERWFWGDEGGYLKFVDSSTAWSLHVAVDKTYYFTLH